LLEGMRIRKPAGRAKFGPLWGWRKPFPSS
jgi:hypothetical protein